MKSIAQFAVAALMVYGLSAVGCTSKPGEQAAESGHEGHVHQEIGPHGGKLIELGGGEYHAEMLHETEAVVYLLDGEVKNAVAVDAPDMVVSVSHDGKSERFTLSATPESADPAGKASRFASNDADLVADLEEGHADVQLIIMLGGKQYRGALLHDHDHAGEGHDH